MRAVRAAGGGGIIADEVAVHAIEAARLVAQLNVTMDVRNAAHGLAVWPF